MMSAPMTPYLLPLQFDARRRNEIERQQNLVALRQHQNNLGIPKLLQPSGPIPLPRNRLRGPDLDLLPSCPFKILPSLERTVQTRGGYFEDIRDPDRILDIQSNRNGTAGLLAVIEGHAPGFVDEKPNPAPPSMPGILHIYELQPHRVQDRPGNFSDALNEI